MNSCQHLTQMYLIPLLHFVHVSREVRVHETEGRMVEVKVHTYSSFVALHQAEIG